MVNFGYPYNDIVICKDSTDYLIFILALLLLTLSDPGYFRQLTIRGGGFKSPPLRSRKLSCQSSPYHTCEFHQVFLA